MCNVYLPAWQTLWYQPFSCKSLSLSAQNKAFQVFPYFVFFWAVSRRYRAASSTSPACLYRLELYLDRLFQFYQQGFFFCQQVFLGRFESFLAGVSGSAVSLNSSFWMHKTWLAYNHCQTHYTNYKSLKTP